MAERGVDLLLFAGGDGTAVDVLEAIGDRVPVLGVPAGVKMHSAVFAVNPKSAGELALRFVDGAVRNFREAEVMDVDEALLRAGSVSARLHGYLKVPVEPRLVQGAKTRTLAGELAAQEGIANHLVEHVLGGRTWFVGPGTTTRAVLQRARAREDAPRRRRRSGTERCSLPTRTSRRCSSSPQPARRASWSRPWAARGSCSGAETSSSRRRSSSVSGGTGSWSSQRRSRSRPSAGPPCASTRGTPALDESLSGYLRVIVAHNREIVYRIAP